MNSLCGGWQWLRFALPLLGLLIATAATADREADLERLREAIELSRERVGAFEQEHRNLLETLEALDLAAIALEREVEVARASAQYLGGSMLFDVKAWGSVPLGDLAAP